MNSTLRSLPWRVEDAVNLHQNYGGATQHFETGQQFPVRFFATGFGLLLANVNLGESEAEGR